MLLFFDQMEARLHLHEKTGDVAQVAAAIGAVGAVGDGGNVIRQCLLMLRFWTQLVLLFVLVLLSLLAEMPVDLAGSEWADP